MKREIQLLISEEFAERIIPENDSVRLLDEIIDSLDLNLLYETYSKNGRKWATEPSVMLKILVYAIYKGLTDIGFQVFQQIIGSLGSCHIL